ncbi:type III PLP-dependent enzyme domain-containing protein [Sediminitomix flava]|uniref:Arginine decarboxylase n=1 Tax=Sediminitomix flava TaxID=379075 RepID=A0A315ZG89_SEDFL|nr:arginine decarboxylase [Sediminitomix flava]PWJ44159.1 arginine decarboxylase [Sediminitomix flava]
MKNYFDLIDQTFDFPTEEFDVKEGTLSFNNVPIMELIEKYGTPLKLCYLPKISQQIQRAQRVFKEAIKKQNYQGDYIYTYCTKSSHFKHVIKETLKNNAQLETSSHYDIEIIKSLYKSGDITNDITILCNGFKPEPYKKAIVDLIKMGFHNCIPIVDNIEEIDYYDEHLDRVVNVGIRVAADEEPDFGMYTSRLGIRYSEVVNLYQEKIAPNPNFKLKLLHFFINSGIRDTQYYWTELNKFIYKYTELKALTPDIDSVDIGGGFPIKYSLSYNYDHEYMASAIVEVIKDVCDGKKTPTPHIITEFGSYTVGESGAIIYSVLDEKLQNDKEAWYIIDGSFITHLPDSWGKNHKFIMLAINNWNNRFKQVHLGGITCDSDDFYNSEAHSANIYLPAFDKKDEKQYIGMFHTGAYQEAIAGYGGISHCLIPDPKMIIIDKDENGNHKYEIFKEQTSSEKMLDILGY